MRVHEFVNSKRQKFLSPPRLRKANPSLLYLLGFSILGEKVIIL